tara:strand:- start:997 stop:1149 length:153 start_codon:yes stop_codon:yes gene_type:complete
MFQKRGEIISKLFQNYFPTAMRVKHQKNSCEHAIFDGWMQCEKEKMKLPS